MNTNKPQRQPPQLVYLPHAILLRPPIAARGSDASARVSTFEFKILAGVLVEARAALSDVGHVRAYAAAGETIKRQGEEYRRFGERWEEVQWARRVERKSKRQAPAPKMRYTFNARRYQGDDYNAHKPMSRKRTMKLAGREGYKNERERQRRIVPEDLMVTVSAYQLLRSSGLASKGRNLRKLHAALARLCEPVGDSPPPLLSCGARNGLVRPDGRTSQDEDGRLHLLVSAAWLRPPTTKFPMPLPDNAAALALALFVRAVSGPHAKRGAIALRPLCDRLGISLQRGNKAALHTLRAALDLVNEWLEALMPVRGALAKYEVYPAAAYKLITVDDHSAARFVAEDYNLDERELLEDEPEEVVDPADERFDMAEAAREQEQKRAAIGKLRKRPVREKPAARESSKWFVSDEDLRGD
jgi:hypothetical protein